MEPKRLRGMHAIASEELKPNETPLWVVAVSALLVSIPLGLCCYLLLKL